MQTLSCLIPPTIGTFWGSFPLQIWADNWLIGGSFPVLILILIPVLMHICITQPLALSLFSSLTTHTYAYLAAVCLPSLESKLQKSRNIGKRFPFPSSILLRVLDEVCWLNEWLPASALGCQIKVHGQRGTLFPTGHKCPDLTKSWNTLEGSLIHTLPFLSL